MNAPRPILVIDDDIDLRETLAEVLAEDGFAVATAAHGLDALQQLQAGLRPGLILLDLMMPVMDGRQFRAEQLKDPELAKVPVVVFSAQARLSDEDAVLKPTCIIKKPFRAETVLDVVRQQAQAAAPAVP